ncbi:hypothetical protein EPUS_00095 [Endocarpon pusillum Z07020]|uniref:Trichothecene 3-O-acetyltransferase n=1 Tax=Endocarpon pusillum (strain Z07020 / HMAS-L-300199) TaxID=1263415 RepID=U1GSE6_ENDPU|nr:uncharacterized protein EPUS_00095 [Endocarpon pusillum Z07020]ERF75303.1 hypothetical protein EPUS_00095 [Endocarpon pusillum Z07020]
MSGHHDVLLSPLDQLMPRVYTRIFLIFKTYTASLAIDAFKRGLGKTCAHISYLKGYVYQPANQRGHLAVAWSDNLPTPEVSHKVRLDLSYEVMISRGISLSTFKDDLCPVRSASDHSTPGKKNPVLAASVGELEGGIFLSIAVHHNVMDGVGFGDLLDLIAQNTKGVQRASATLLDPDEPLYREPRLRQALDSGKELHHQDVDTDLKSLLANHPEYTMTPPSMPSQFPACTSKLLIVTLEKIEATKQTLTGSMPFLTTNMIVSSLLWSCITRVRCARAGTNAIQKSRLGMAVNGRQRLGAGFANKNYLSNVNMYALTELQVNKVTSCAATQEISGAIPPREMIEVFEAVAASTSSDRISSRHVGEVVGIVDQLEDIRSLFPGWNFYHGPDLSITSWANLNTYEADFGEYLGRPGLVRVSYAEFDGLCIILPRRRTQHSGGGQDVIEVIIRLQADDLARLQEDEVWKTWAV